jgi:hypothetical protein
LPRTTAALAHRLTRLQRRAGGRRVQSAECRSR